MQLTKKQAEKLLERYKFLKGEIFKKFQFVDIKIRETGIPESFTVIIITKPDDDMLSKELELDEFCKQNHYVFKAL